MSLGKASNDNSAGEVAATGPQGVVPKVKATPWPVRVDLETRKVIKKAAALRGLPLEDFFRNELGQYSQRLIDESVLGDRTDPPFVSQDEFADFKSQLLNVVEEVPAPGGLSMLDRVRRLLRQR